MTLIYYLIETGAYILGFAVFPFFGLFIQKKLSKTKIIIILSTALILFFPVLLGYSYVFPLVNELLFLTIVSCVYGLFIVNLKLTLAFTGITFACLMFLTFLGMMAGKVEIRNEWNVDKYRIQYFEERGFSGGPLLGYKLSKYTQPSIFIKELEIKVDNDTLHNCLVNFEKSKFTFDKCAYNEKNSLFFLKISK
ncbi:hypothetical protein [Pedobacter frigiditerrae]|uniref:hypothetical protein n=1 Tax=Pedobacter frigiditerrae TaxID=2530452 RepID=UPI00292E48C5|nr:hypothetical protein [Pedobacter frigiditerrae]